MSARLVAVEAARRVLDVTKAVPYTETAEAVEDIRKLRGALEQLLAVVERQPRSVRLAAQHDEEFRNLARAARTEIHAARGSLRRLDAFESALSDILGTDGGQL
jgi:hypothetical protein